MAPRTFASHGRASNWRCLPPKLLHKPVAVLALAFVLLLGLSGVATAAGNPAGGAIAGKVAAEGGAASLSGVRVMAYRFNDGSHGAEYWGCEDSVRVEPGGTYRFSGLRAGTYRIRFVDPAKLLEPQVYGYLGSDIDDARGKSIFLKDGQTCDGVNLTLHPSESFSPQRPAAQTFEAPAARTLAAPSFSRAMLAAPTGSITGYVSGEASQALSGVWVDVYRMVDYGNGDFEYDYVRSAYTSDGFYTVTGLAAGIYKVAFYPTSRDWAAQVYDGFHGGRVREGGTPVVLGEGGCIGVNVTLVRSSHITGRVVADDTKAGISGVRVRVGFDEDGWFYETASGYTADDGSYDVGGLAPGSYKVQFREYEGRYISEYYDDVTVLNSWNGASEAQWVNVGTSEIKSGVNASLAPAGAISGTVRAEDGPIDPWSCYISIYRVVNAGTEDEYWNSVDRDYSMGEDGTYRLGGLPAGQYVVQFDVYDGRHVSVFYNNVAGEVSDSTDCNLVTVTAGATASGIDAVVPVGGSITGTVVSDDTGQPITNASVSAYLNSSDDEDGYWERVASGYTDSQGQYAIAGLRGGQYQVHFNDYQGNYVGEIYNNVPTTDVDDSRVTPISVALGQTTSGINASLATAGHLTGSVITTSGAPIARAWVLAWQQTGEGEDADWDVAWETSTDATGSYDIGGLRTGSYRIQFYGRGDLLGEFYDNVPTDDLADARCADVTATAGQTVVLNPATLVLASHISGTVSVPGTATTEGINVEAFVYGSEGWSFAASGYTDAGGGYDIGDLRSGQYKVRFRDKSGTWTPQMYSSSGNVSTWRVEDSRAETLTIVDEQSISGINANMSPAAHIKGRVTSSQTGRRVAGARVQAYVWDAGVGDQGFWNEINLDLPMNSTSPDDHVGRSGTDVDGSYDVGGLAPGRYVVGFYDTSGCHDSEMYDDIPGLIPSAQNVQAFDIMESGEVRDGIDAELRSLDDYEATDSTAAAVPLDVFATRFRTLYDAGDVDWVRLDLLGGVPYRIASSGARTVDTVFALYDEAGNEIASDDDGGIDTFSRIDYTPEADQTVYLKVYGYFSYTVGPYSLSFDSVTKISGVPDGWVTHDVAFTLDSSTARPGYDRPYYSTWGGPVQYSTPVTITAEGRTNISYWSQNASGVVDVLSSKTAYIDKSAPTVTTAVTGANTANARVTISANDENSGVRYITYRIDGGAETWLQVLSDVGQVTTPLLNLTGSHTVTYTSMDIAGNLTTGSKTFNGAAPAPTGGGDPGPAADVTKPTMTVSGVPSGWSRSDVTFTLSAKDDSGKAPVVTWNDGTGSKAYESAVTISKEGTTTVSWKAKDEAGNEESGSFLVLIDRSAPSAPGSISYTSLTAETVTLLWPAASDAGSGVSAYEVTDNGQVVKTVAAPATSVSLAGLAHGSSHLFSVVAVDVVGNRSAATDMTLVMPTIANSTSVQTGASQTVTITVPSIDTSAPALDATVTITGVTQGGELTIVRAEYPPTLAPATFRFLGEYFDVSFSGAFNGTVTVTLPYDPRIPDARAVNMKLKHYTRTGWEDVETTVDLVAHTLTATLTSLSPVVAVEPEATVTSATISISKTVVESYRHGAKLTAKLKSLDASGSPLAGFTLLVQKSIGADEWSTVATMTPSGASGTYSAMLPAMSFSTSMRVVLADNPLYVSTPTAFTVMPAASIAAPRSSTSRARAYRAFSVTGVVKPAHASTVSIECYKVSGTRRTKVKTLTVKTSSRGTFSASFKLARGTYVFKAVHSDTSHAKTSSSYSAKVSVR